MWGGMTLAEGEEGPWGESGHSAPASLGLRSSLRWESGLSPTGTRFPCSSALSVSPWGSQPVALISLGTGAPAALGVGGERLRRL